jgi:hypothetical protein
LFFVCSSSPSNVRSLQLRPVPPLSHIKYYLEGIAFRNVSIILQKIANVNTFF